jgi:ELWxxDGT repeat protein
MPFKLNKGVVMKKIFSHWGILMITAALALSTCGGGGGSDGPAGVITGFSLTDPSATGTIDETNHTISITLLRGTDVTALAPAITHNGASVSPASGTAQNFTNSMTYTVTTADGSDQAYTVTISFKALLFADDGTSVKLWVSDGTETGTKLLKDITNWGSWGGIVSPVTMKGKTYFQADDGTNGLELWVSDGTEAGTTMVKDLNASGDSYIRRLIVMNDSLYFFATDGTHNNVLYKSDGTDAGTVPLGNVWVGDYNDDTDPGEMTAMNGQLFFAADDGTHGRELWVSNGTSAGTRMLKDINTDGSTSSDPYYFAVMGGKLYFSAYDGYMGSGHGTELWVSDGTETGTTLFCDIYVGNGSPAGLKVVNGKIFFSANDSHGYELWVSDGTVSGTKMVKDIVPGSDGSMVNNIIPINGKILFSAYDTTHGHELWVSDGTEAGTKMVKDIAPGSDDSWPGNYPAYFTVMNGKVFFGTSDLTNGTELWASDGTEAGTRMVKDINFMPGGNSSVSQLFAMNGRLFFFAIDGFHGYELWASDGTEAGTKMVKDINLSGDAIPQP